MADEACSSTHKENPVEFPPLCLLDALVRSFPKEWRGVFSALPNTFLFKLRLFGFRKEMPLKAFQTFLQVWAGKIIWMQDFPVVLNDQLFFKPKLLFLPLNIQCNMQAFISYHSCSVPANSLDKLIHSLRKFEAEIIGWRLTHLKILKSKLKNFRETDSRDCRGSEES